MGRRSRAGAQDRSRQARRLWHSQRGLVQESRGEDKLLDLYLPIGLIALGFGLTMLLSTTFNAMIVPIPTAAMHAGLKLVLGFVLLAIGGIFCVQWGEIAFGEPGPAALKLAAMAIAPPAVAGIISFLVHDAPPVGWGMVGFFLAFGMFFTLNHYLFEWDMSEKWVVTGMATIVTMLAVPFLFAFIVDGGGCRASHASNNEDAEVDYLFELREPVSLQKWMDDSRNRIFGLTRDDCERSDQGASTHADRPRARSTSRRGPQAAEIYVRSPSDSKKRKPSSTPSASGTRGNSSPVTRPGREVDDPPLHAVRSAAADVTLGIQTTKRKLQTSCLELCSVMYAFGGVCRFSNGPPPTASGMVCVADRTSGACDTSAIARSCCADVVADERRRKRSRLVFGYEP
jgi:hypothetical protein